MRVYALLLPLFVLLAGGVHGLSPGESLRLRLLRHPPRRSAADMARRDQARARLAAQRLAWSGSDCEDKPPALTVPIFSGADIGEGQYLVRLRVGTPPQTFVVVADTGSDLTWVKCRLGRPDPRWRRPFDPDRSSSFVPVPCSSPLCTDSLPFSLAQCPSPTSPCQYDYGYADGSSAKGIFAEEVATVGSPGGGKTRLDGLVVGCTSSSVGSSFRAVDGVLGLGYSNTSFAARATSAFRGKFSYCLVDHLSPRNASDYIVFGGSSRPGRWRRYAELVLGGDLKPFYAIRVAGITVGGAAVNVSDAVWDSAAGGGTILDTGTSLTLLAEPAYRAVADRLSAALGELERVDMKPFEFCYKWEGVFDEKIVPKLVVRLRGRGGSVVRLRPPVKSYLIDVADGVKCIGILSAPWPGISTIGNILQQNYLWEFDVANRLVSFKHSSCTHR
ncbi:aspartic proteinase NANA, chloroplast-like [Wolffia australiana]